MSSTQLITNYFRLHNANQFKESLSEVANSAYYVFAAKHLPYAGGDSIVPPILNTVDATFYEAYREMVFGKRVGLSDIKIMTVRHDWIANTKYASYDNAVELTSLPYYVSVNGGASYHIFKCLDNNKNAYSIVAPDVTQTSPDDEFYQTSDGYVWKYMYSVDSATFSKFATAKYMPIVANNEVAANAVAGAIEVIRITTRGSNYNTFLTSTFISTDLRVGGNPVLYNIANNASSATNFYTSSFLYIVSGTGAGQGRKIVGYNVTGNTKTVTLESAFTTDPNTTSQYEITPYVLITGDGSGATARATVNTSLANGISSVEIINRGSGYTYATAMITGNTGGVSNNAVVVPVLGPKGGHGFNPEYELGGSSVGISVTFANTETGTIPANNDYRMIGVLKDPLFANVVITVGSVTGGFTIGETVVQANTGTTGVVTAWDAINTLQLTNVNGVVLTGNSTVNYLTGQSSLATSAVVGYQINGMTKNFNTFDQRYRYTHTMISGTFAQDERVYQTINEATYHSTTGANIYFTHLNGVLNTGNTVIGNTSGAVANLTFAYPPDLVVGSGEILHCENQSPITRGPSQSETVKLILQF